MKLNFSAKIDDIEVRSCDIHLCKSGEHVTAEIIKWEKESCYVLAYWVEDSEGFYLKFVGRRPFNDCNKDTFWTIADFGQTYLDLFFESEDYHE